MLSVNEVAEHFNCSEQYIRRLIKDGKIEAERVGHTWLIPNEVVEEITIDDIKKASKGKTEDRVSKRKFSKSKLNVLSFFSGAMGLDIGLERAGMNVLLACEKDEATRKTILKNESNVGLIGDLLDYNAEDIIRYANLQSNDQVDVIVGGPPCQAFSTAGRRMGFQDERGNVFLKFIELITTIKPKYAVIENVRGLMSTPMGIDVNDAITKQFTFDPKDFSGSSLYYVKKRLEHAGYNITFNLYNSANFGVPQIRERVVIVCTLLADKVPYLTPTHNEDGSHGLNKWLTFKDAIKGLDKKKTEHVKFSEKRMQYINMLKPGQNWRDLPAELQPEAMGNSFHLGGGKTGFYRRLSWDRPSPTLVTHPAMPATELAHPTEPRPLSVEEYKRVQQFPDEWEIQGSTIDKYRQIGNAVPVGLGYAIGKEIINHFKNKKSKSFENFRYSRYTNTSDIDFERDFLKQVRVTLNKKNTYNLELGF
jgi:DNA (cytosine-5)-methyltransferase 1